MVGSVRQAALASGVSPFVVRRWVSRECSLSLRGRLSNSKTPVMCKIQGRDPGRRMAVDRAGGSPDGNPPGQSQAWDSCRLCGGLCL